MKYLFIAAIVLLTACTLKTETEYTINDNKALLAVGNDATDTMMTAIAKEFKDNKGIEIDFSKSKFDESGKIKYLNLKVKVAGSAGGVESETIGNGEHRYGFEVNYSGKDGTTLMMGKVDDIGFSNN